MRNKSFLESLARRIGEVQEVQVTLPNGFVGEFIRVRVRLDVSKKLTRVVRFTKAGETESYSVKFEKLPTFCYECGMMGHWYEECGSGEHDTTKFEWGPFILASRGGARRGRPGAVNRGEVPEMSGRRGRGRGRRDNNFGDHGQNPRDTEHENVMNQAKAPVLGKGILSDYDPSRSWRFNAQMDPAANIGTSSLMTEQQHEDPLVLGKRAAHDSISRGLTNDPLDQSTALVPVGNTAVIAHHFEGSEEEPLVDGGTPQKSLNRKKLKGTDGEAVTKKSGNTSATSEQGDRREQ